VGALRIGDLLVGRGVITAEQRDAILAEQRNSGRPFGVLAERLFNVSAEAVEDAWADQYVEMAPLVDPRKEPVDPYVRCLINRRQAWQFRVLPLWFDGEELVICTTRKDLPRALRFTAWSVGHRCVFVIAPPEHLDAALTVHYPMPGLGIQKAAS
jgi:hypothetical protein